ncbi:cadherin-like beta sandwich domain-containing protein [[Eubacterium] rectale]|uniref:cadherin-like beta sandwich domain-containing protein n=1 Tax=Agathobacter rectalis TaxID=39491 RepID=UPI0015711361|nr:cadherin-like beta sandwich domain-containing protein [Agathobacter rectalis]NSI72195.1 cadherin-like beta sandwich domain-containing protein [Agathobacter rectalis]NSI78095.1 cadherin-like beta sandwich domain-containing protein [Agathobacter rectalis]NSI92682.1 cadherin-like beta sandwich domain-containing protein [Agathobacter rectalis]NSJ07833.1 cadherin-like beta sandwich domain-containing protein [Agathobacter rectalis]
MKKLFGCILSLVMAVMLVFTPAEHVYAQGLGLSVSSSSVAVGKTVKVTVSMPSGYFGTVVISSSDEGVLSNGGDGVANIGDAAGPEYPTSRSFSFTAKAAGSCTIKAYCTVVGDAEANDAGGIITGASTKVTVTSASSNNDSNSNKDNKDNSGSNTGNDSNANKDNENKEEKKSSNASLGSLVISAGTLSPEFSAATKDYTATVDYSCSSLAVTANPADSKASVTSVTGNDSLEVGENTVSVVVTAEDGSTSTYNIVVTRRAEDDPENADKQDNWKKFDINGTEWTMVNDIPEDVVPEGFEHSKTVIDGLEYNTLHGTFGDVTLVYLQSESGNGLFVYDAAQNAAYEFVRINSESHFIVVLLPKVDDVPEGYNEISLSIEGKGVATAYQTKVEKTDDQTKDFYLVYAMNDNGESGWYTYDSVDGTYMRTKLSTPTVAQDENDTTKSELVPGIANKYLVLAAILVLVIFILLLLLIVSAVKNRRYKAVDDEEDDDSDAEDVSNVALDEATDETADEIADELEEEVTEEPLDEVAEEAAEESVDEVAGEAAEESAGEAAEETADEAVEEPADEVAEETAEDVADEQKMATDENISNASYVGRTVEIIPDSKKAVENENSEFDLKDDSRQENVSDTENDADEDALKNQLQMALDGFVNEENKPSETIDSSAKDDNEDDSEDDDLQFIDLN